MCVRLAVYDISLNLQLLLYIAVSH